MRNLTKNELVDKLNKLFSLYPSYKLEVNEDDSNFQYKVSIDNKWYELTYENSLDTDRQHRRSLMLQTFEKWEKKYD